MSPAVAKTSDREVIAVARALIERDGAEALSMQAVADAIGIRPPSLYKRFPDRARLLLAVELQALAELERVLRRAADASSPTAQLKAMAHAYRRFARRHPRLYALVFSGVTPRDPQGTAARRGAAEPALAAFAALVGPARALPAARVLTAFLHGFVAMENAEEFRLGSGVDQAFKLGLDTIVSSLSR